MSEYYDGVKILATKDLNGDTPEIFMVTSNRSAGKTTYFQRLMVNRFLKRGEKFAIFFRYNYELDDCADAFFKDIGELFFRGMTMRSERRLSGLYHELFLDDKPCGYAMAINGADTLKKKSQYFSDVANIFFDEFQSETGHYCPQELRKFKSLHMSIARGQNKQVRYVPVYMASNPVSLLNPYYLGMGISSRLRDDTKILRGKGFVLEQGFNESASKAQRESGFNKAFVDDDYIDYATQAVYLNDSKAFIEKPTGSSRYLCTLRYEGKEYAIREYVDSGIVYCDDRPDSTFTNRISVTTEDHQINYVMLKRNDFFLAQMRYFFERGCFRFKDLQCKDALLKALSY